jgi:signal transduction histidine kinase
MGLPRHHRALKFLKGFWSWLNHPVVVFIVLQIIWTAITVLWVVWFIEESEEINRMARTFGGENFDSRYALIVLVVGCVLLGMLLVGTVTLFVSSLRQRRLIQQQKNFVSSVTHELRSPLSSLQLAFETLRYRNLDENTKQKMMDMALGDIERLSRLVSQILVSARLDRGLPGFEINHEVLSLRELLDKSVEKSLWLDPNIKERITVDCPKDLRTKSTRPILTIILSNLIENAIKYSPPGSPILIFVSCSQDELTVGVKDQGFGLDKFEQKRIFRMFYRAPLTKQKAISGTGLGLFVVKALAQVLGGKAWVQSEGRGLGSTFFVSFPKWNDDIR